MWRSRSLIGRSLRFVPPLHVPMGSPVAVSPALFPYRTLSLSHVNLAATRKKKDIKAEVLEAQELVEEDESSVNVTEAEVKPKKVRKGKDIPLSASESETQSTSVYIDLIKSLLVSGEIPQATEILEKMPQQGWKVPTFVCNMVILPWLEQGGNLGLKQARKVFNLMRTHRVKFTERTVALALYVAFARQEEELVHDMLTLVESTAMDPMEVAMYVELHGALRKSRSKSALPMVEKLQAQNALFAQIMEHALHMEVAKTPSADLPEGSAVAAPLAPPVTEELALNPLYREQLSLETRANEEAVQKYRNAMQEVISLGRGANMAPAQDILLLWYEPLVRAISEEHRRIGAKDSARDRSVYGPKLLSVDAERLAVITIHEVLGLLMANPAGVKFVTLAQGIGTAVQAEYNFTRARQEGSQLVNYLRTTGELLTVNTVNKVARFSQNAEGPDVNWGPKLQVKVGGVLIELLSNVARVPPNLSYLELARFKKEQGSLARVKMEEDWPLAFRHGYRYAGKKKFGTIYCLPEVLETIENGHKIRETVHARYLPMLVEPRPWTAPHSGGYLAYKTWVMRTKGSDLQRQSLMDAQVEKVYKALDVLGSTAWRVNTFVQEVVVEAWEAGGGELDLPSRRDLEIPPPPTDFTDDPKARRKFQALQRRVVQQQRDLHGLRCALKYQLAVATEFADRVFYFPHNLDFRGRSYPIPPHLNQMGSDLCRGLLKFAESKPLGPNGLSWLKVHVANLYGNDKITHDDRIAFVEQNLDAIRQSARTPLAEEGSWWKGADNPWQALAACKALDEALSYEGGPEAYPCNIPVHQDGSCNGLQHYAALGGDVWGAEQVNLLPRDTPQDVYGGVAKLVSQRVAEDAANGVRMGVLLNGKVSRKIVKQTVMTSVYGVTFVGARKQIYNAMRSQLPEINEDDLFQASGYIARHTFSALEAMFVGARHIMAWLASCAQAIAKAGRPVMWVTPLGLPVVQPYRRAGRSAVRTLVQTVILEEQNDKLPVNVARQKSAFAPNYIHSLDSTHMMLTALKMDEMQLPFASVHDSYWALPSDIDKMNVALRESFVQLHSEPLLEQLAASFRRHHPDITFPPVPKKGDLDLSEVLKSPYFFH